MDLGKLLATEDRTAIERWCRSMTQQVYIGDGRVLCRILGKLYCYVHGQDTGIAPYLMLDGYWEMWITQAVARYVKPGMSCVDVGASFGYYTLLLSELVGAGGHVAALEPDRASHQMLVDSLTVNGFEGTEISLVAAGERRACADLHKPSYRWSDARVLDVRDTLEADANTVSVAPLDALYPSTKVVDFIKIDAEGSEPAIWRGMQGLLNRCNPVVLMEFAPHLLASAAAELLQTIQAAGYPLRHVATNGNPEPVTAEQLLAGGVDMLWLER